MKTTMKLITFNLLLVFCFMSQPLRAQKKYDLNNGDALLFALGSAYNSSSVMSLISALNDSGQYHFDGARPSHSFDFPSQGIGLDFNINFTLYAIRLYDDGFSKLKYPYSLPLNLMWKQEIDSVFFGNSLAQIDSSNPFKLIFRLDHITGEAFFKDNLLNMLRFTASENFVLKEDEKNVTNWGVRVMPNGKVISGNCNDGIGVMVWDTEGARYEGEWYYGMPDGKGNLKLESGLSYSGSFLSGFFWGQGKLEYPGNFKYEGSFTMGQRNGPGTAIFSDGSVYTGNWVNNSMEGQGAYSLGKRFEYRGNFHNNKFEGEGILSTPEGTHTGRFKDSKPNGKGKMVSSRNGSQLEGNWVNGVKQGEFTLTEKNGNTRKVFFQDDIEMQ